MSTKNVKAGLSKANVNAIAGAIGTATLNRLIPIFSTSVAYTKGQYTNYNNQLYRFTADKAAGAWDSTKVESASLNDLIHDVNEAVNTINDKANVDGNYPSMTVGLADNLNSKIMQNDVDAYNFRTAGGSKEIGNKCKENAIIGGSLGFNQLVNFDNNVSSTAWGGGTYSIASHKVTVVVNASESTISYGVLRLGFLGIAGHKYLAISDTNVRELGFFLYNANTAQQITVNTITSLANPTTDEFRLNYYRNGGLAEQATYTFSLMCIDLTAMLGSKIADYVYGLEQNEAGAGVAWFRRYWKKPYYPYTPIGAFQHVITRGKKIVDFNHLDNSTFVKGRTDNGVIGYADGTSAMTITETGVSFTTTIGWRGVVSGLIKIMPNTSYYLKIEGITSNVNAYVDFYDADGNWLRKLSDTSVNNKVFSSRENECFSRVSFMLENVGSISLSNINFNFHYDGERDGEYEAHKSSIEQCDAVPLIGIFDIDEDGNLICDGNRYNYDGTVDEDFGEKDLAELVWERNNYAGAYYFFAKADMNYTTNSDAYGNIFGICSLYGNAKDTNDLPLVGNIAFDCSYKGGGWTIAIRDDSVSSTEELITKLTDKGAIVYKKKISTQSSATPFAQVQDAYNWGTEEYLDPENDTRPCEVPVGHDTDYPLDCKSKLEIMPDLPTTDGVYACKVTSGTAEYTSLASWLGDNGYIKPTTVTGYDAAKTQVLKNVEGTLTWVDEE